MLNKTDLEAKLFRQYKLETSASQDVKLEQRKSKNKSEIKRILNDAGYIEAQQYIANIQSAIAQIHQSQAATSILTSKDMDMLTKLNFYDVLVNQVFAEIVSERRAYFDAAMDSYHVAQSDKAQLCEIVANTVESYNFDQPRIDRAEKFLSKHRGDRFASKLDQESAQMANVISGTDEQVIGFLERLFAEGRRSYHGNDSLYKIQMRLKSMVTRLSQDFSQLDEDGSIKLFNSTLARIVSPTAADNIRNLLRTSRDWNEINTEILTNIDCLLESASERTFPTSFIPNREEDLKEQVGVDEKKPVIEHEKLPAALAPTEQVKEELKQAESAQSAIASNSGGMLIDLRRDRARNNRKRPPTRNPRSKQPSHDDDNDSQSQPEAQSSPQTTIAEAEAQPQAATATTTQSRRRQQATSMYVGDPRKMQQMLAAGAAAATLRGASSSTSSTSLRNNLPQIDLNQLIGVITFDIM